MDTTTQFSRRAIIAGMAMGITSVLGRQVLADAQKPTAAFSLPEEIEVLDFRLFPTDDGMRFIVEVGNATDIALDTPTIGVVIPGLQPDGNYGWAVPITNVIHPNSSGVLIGVAPKALRDDDDWGAPIWMLCDEIQSTNAIELLPFDIDFTHELEVLGPRDVLASITVTNRGVPLDSNVTIRGLVRDGDGRACGSTVPIWLTSVDPGTTEVLKVRFGPTVEYTANPIALLTDASTATVDFTFDTWAEAISPGCSPVMPWNR